MSLRVAGRILGIAIVAALAVYYLPQVLFEAPGSILSAIAAALVVGTFEYRRIEDKGDLPDRFWVAIAVGALVLYLAALISGAVPGDAGDWLAMALVFAFPVVVLVQIYLKRRRRSDRVGGG